MITLHENTRLVIVSAESFYTIHITQRNFGLPVRKTDKITSCTMYVHPSISRLGINNKHVLFVYINSIPVLY